MQLMQIMMKSMYVSKQYKIGGNYPEVYIYIIWVVAVFISIILFVKLNKVNIYYKFQLKNLKNDHKGKI